MTTIEDIEKLEARYKKLVLERERQQVRLEDANRKLAEYGITAENLEVTIEKLTEKINEMNLKLENNIEKLDIKLTSMEKLL